MSKRERVLNPFEEDRDPPKRRRSRSRSTTSPKKRRLWPILLLLLLALIFFLPNLLGLTGLHQHVVNFAAKDFQGKISVGSASLGWLQPIQLSGVSITDDAGNDLFKAEQIKSNQSLYSMLNLVDLGRFDILRPTIYLELRPDGSNLETALAKYLEPADDPSSKDATQLPKISLNVVEGRGLVTSSTDVQSWQINDLNGIVQTDRDTAPLTMDANCSITPMHVDETGQVTLQPPGKISLSSQVDPGASELQFTSLDVIFNGGEVPLSIAAPLIQRFVGPAQTMGQMSGQFKSRINLATQAVRLDIENLNVKGFGLAAKDLLGSDQIQFESLTANGILDLSPTIISGSNFDLKSDFGRVNANGQFDLNQLSNLAAQGTLPQTPFQMDGELDLAGMVRMLPTTLQLHQDLQVESGTVKFQANSQFADGATRMVVNLDASNLKAKRGTQNIIWQNPLRLVGTVIQSSQGLAIEDLLCESDFLTIAGSGAFASGTFRAKGDLDQLVKRVEQFANLSGMQLAGEIDGTFGWQTAQSSDVAQKPVQIGGTLLVTNPVIKFPELPVWQQPKLAVKWSGAGKSNLDPAGRTLQLDQGGIQINVGTEQAILTLAAPIQNVLSDAWQMDCQITGGLGGWVRHIQNFVDLGQITADGDLRLHCDATLTGNQLQLANVDYEVQQLGFDGYGMTIRDPRVTGKGNASYDLVSGRVTIPNTTLTAQSIAAIGQNLNLLFAEKMQTAGVIAFRGDVNRIADWHGLSPTDESIHWYGSVEGNLQLASNDYGIGGRLTSVFTDLIAAQRETRPGTPNGVGMRPVSTEARWIELLKEPTTNLNSDILLRHDFDAFQFTNLELTASALKLKANGSISDLAQTMQTEMKGSWNPNWQKINALLGAYSGNLVQLSGSGEQPFQLRGPLYATSTNSNQPVAWIPPELEAATSIRWDQGSVANVAIGASQINVDVRNSLATIKTEGIPFTGGVVRFAPSVDMRGENPILLMDQTRIIDNVQLSPETARQWLKYVAPLAADATSAQGNFTVDAKSVRMPIMNPMDMEARGAIRMKDVVIGAGPLAEQLLTSIQQVRGILKPEARNDRDLKTWLQMSEQTIPIVIQNQRVFHDNVTFTHKDLTLKTRGSVGFDQSLSMVAEIPIEDDWIAGKSYLAGLKGQSLSIPISGTVSKPQLDQRAIQELSSQLVKQAASGALNQAIGEKLTPKINEFQNQINNKLQNELNGFQSKLGEKLLPGFGGQTPAANPPGGGTQQPLNGGSPNQPQPGSNPQTDIRNQLEGELLKGIGNLFGRDK